MALANPSFALTAYPISSDFKRKLITVIADNTTEIAISQIRDPSYFRTLKNLRSINADRLYIPIEDENSFAILPILKLVSFFTRTRSIYIVTPSLEIRKIPRIRILAGIFPFTISTIACYLAGLRARLQLLSLARQNRIHIYDLPKTHKSALYLKTNLWFGIKAGGSVGHIAGVINGFSRIGYSILFASAEPPVMLNTSIPFIKVEAPSSYGLPYELNNYRFQYAFWKHLRKTINFHELAFIYQRLSSANFLGVLLSRFYSIPLIVEYNGSEVWVSQNWGRGLQFPGLASLSESVMLKHAHLVVTVSNVLRDQLLELGVHPDRIVTYPNCVDPNIYSPGSFNIESRMSLRSDLNIPKSALLFSFVGTFGPWHGADKLASVIIELNRSHRDWLDKHPIHFLFVGDGVNLQSVKDLIVSAKVDHLCTFTGLVPQDKTPKYLLSSDVLLSPHVPNSDGTRFFGSPTKLFEYMACQKPIIASSLEQISEVLSPSVFIDSSFNGELSCHSKESVAITVPPGSVNDFITAIKYLTENSDIRDQLGKNARQLAVSRYTWDCHVQHIFNTAKSINLLP